LLDAYNPKEHGGTGETFDWKIARKVRKIFPKMYLAGGLSDSNVKTAIEEVNPFGVDVCSAVERYKGKKDEASLMNFISEAKGSVC
jgi:phosphoribosylanthranilate isomerase